MGHFMHNRARRTGWSHPLRGGIVAAGTLLLAAAVAVGHVARAAEAAGGEPKPAAQSTESKDPAFKDWRLHCETPKGADKQVCYLYETLAIKDRGPVLNVAIGYAKNQKVPVAIFTTPLGISLPPGISLQVDEGEPVRFPVEICVNGGCKALLAVKDEILSTLKIGKEAKVTFHDAARRPVTLPVSLQGFTAGFKALEDAR